MSVINPGLTVSFELKKHGIPGRTEDETYGIAVELLNKKGTHKNHIKLSDSKREGEYDGLQLGSFLRKKREEEGITVTVDPSSENNIWKVIEPIRKS